MSHEDEQALGKSEPGRIVNAQEKDWSIWKLLAAIALTTGLFIGLTYGLARINLLNKPLDAHAGLILVVTIGSVIIKMLLGDIASGGFSWHKHGYDFCTMTMGAVLSSLTVQLTSDTDLFPGLSLIGSLSAISQDVPTQRRLALFIFLIFSLVGALFTARISKAINEQRAFGTWALSLCNFSLGSAILGFYILVLVTKG